MRPSRVIRVVFEDRKREDCFANPWSIGKVLLDELEIIMEEAEAPDSIVIELPLLQDGNDLVEKLPILQLPQDEQENEHIPIEDVLA